MHKKIFLILAVMSLFSMAAFAAKYKVNSGGKVTGPNGKVQQNSVLTNTYNPYNNYSSQRYTASRQVLVQKIDNIDIVMDYSGSMLFWISEAKRSMAAIISQLPVSTKIGFRVFGHDGCSNPYHPVMAKVKNIVQNKDGKYKVTAANSSYLGNTAGSCSATKQVAALASNNTSGLLQGMNSVDVGGSTPLTLALDQAVTYDFAGIPLTQQKKIILITDGGENCGGDPCAFASALIKQRRDIVIDVLLVSSSSKALRCLSDTTGGKFYNAEDVNSFTSTLTESMTQTAQPSTQKQPEPQQKYEFLDEN